MKTILLVLLLSPLASVGAHYLGVVPNGGNSSLPGSFNTSSSARLQQVYEDFVIAGWLPVHHGVIIYALQFSVDENSIPFSETFPQLQINFSTTQRGQDALSTVFAENIGPDETVVFGPGPISLRGSPGVFHLTEIRFDRPFFYNPEQGHLLMDIRNWGPTDASPFDAWATLGDGISTISTGISADKPTGGYATHGLSTTFLVDIVPIPEPRSWTLLGLGLAALAWRWRYRRRASPVVSPPF